MDSLIMRTQSNYLSATERGRIHHDSLRILAEVGVRFRSDRARKLLAGHGARVDHDRDSQLAERSTYEEWLKLGRPDMYAKAKKKVESILASPLKQPLPADVAAKLEEIMRRADEELQ
jgi:trimethylamine:corrinoid methyltransferase-like protein